jgi:hypothetical protein
MVRNFLLLIAVMTMGLSGVAVASEFDDIEDVPVWHLTVEIRTSFSADYGDTDDTVKLTLNGSPLYPGESFGLDIGRDDRKWGQTDHYAVSLPDVATVGDIEMLKLEKFGDDMWCFEEIEVSINYNITPLFEIEWEGDGHCIDSDNGLSPEFIISGSDLRKSKTWNLDSQPTILDLPDSLPLSHAAYWIECAGGDAMSNVLGLRYGDKDGARYVEADRRDDYFADVTMDLTRWWYVSLFEEEWDFETEMGVECYDGEFRMRIDPDNEGYFTESFERIETTIERLNDLAGDEYECEEAYLSHDGDIVFDWVEVDDGFSWPSWPGFPQEFYGGSWGFAL